MDSKTRNTMSGAAAIGVVTAILLAWASGRHHEPPTRAPVTGQETKTSEAGREASQKNLPPSPPVPGPAETEATRQSSTKSHDDDTTSPGRFLGRRRSSNPPETPEVTDPPNTVDIGLPDRNVAFPGVVCATWEGLETTCVDVPVGQDAVTLPAPSVDAGGRPYWRQGIIRQLTVTFREAGVTTTQTMTVVSRNVRVP